MDEGDDKSRTNRVDYVECGGVLPPLGMHWPLGAARIPMGFSPSDGPPSVRVPFIDLRAAVRSFAGPKPPSNVGSLGNHVFVVPDPARGFGFLSDSRILQPGGRLAANAVDSRDIPSCLYGLYWSSCGLDALVGNASCPFDPERFGVARADDTCPHHCPLVCMRISVDLCEYD